MEAGQLPIHTAVMIAGGTDEEVQRALSEAYDTGLLRGARLRAVQPLIGQRRASKAPKTAGCQLSGADLVRVYERHTHQQRALVQRSRLMTERLAVLISSLRRLLADDHFVTLLRAEGLRTMPEHLATRVGACR